MKKAALKLAQKNVLGIDGQTEAWFPYFLTNSFRNFFHESLGFLREIQSQKKNNILLQLEQNVNSK